MFENPRRGRPAGNFTTNVPKIVDLKTSSEQIFSENWRWVPLPAGIHVYQKALFMECFDIKYWIRLPRFWLSLSKKNDKKIPAGKCDNQCCKWIHPKYSNALRGALAVGRKMGSAIAPQRARKLLHSIQRSLICNYKESKKPCSHYYLILLYDEINMRA